MRRHGIFHQYTKQQVAELLAAAYQSGSLSGLQPEVEEGLRKGGLL
jgi:hypothetical protein